MKKKLDEEKKGSPDYGKINPDHEDNRAWALEWDGAALAAMRAKKGDIETWDKP